MGKRGTALFLFLCLTILTSLLGPKYAYADDGFVGGLQDLVGARTIDSHDIDYESVYSEEYEPEPVRLRSGDEIVNDDATVNDYINDVVQRSNTVTFFGSELSLLSAARSLLGNGQVFKNLYVNLTVALVFMWWGVRKAIKMLFAAFRKGRASV